MSVLALSLAFTAGIAAAQSGTVTPAIPQIGTPTPTPIPEDPRLSVCTGPTLSGFAPYIVRAGDRLADLLRGIPGVSVTQIASLNCIDNPEALPAGAVIWLPAQPALDAEPDSSDDDAEIMTFEASAETVQNQAAVDFSWEATGSAAYFYACPFNATEAACPRPFGVQALPVEYTITDIGGFIYPGDVRYRLEVIGEEETVTEDVTLAVTCSQPPLVPNEGQYPCPQDPAQSVFAAWQPFQGGIMMWFFDRDEIWVMLNEDNRLIILEDTYEEGAEELDDEAPENFFTPTRGFGQAWNRLGRAEGLLGWGLQDSIGFDSARQAAGPRSFTTYIQGPGESVYAITYIPQLDIGYWTQVAG